VEIDQYAALSEAVAIRKPDETAFWELSKLEDIERRVCSAEMAVLLVRMDAMNKLELGWNRALHEQTLMYQYKHLCG
jgi:hypothetical protein